MIDRSAFVRDLQKQLAKIERDLLERSDSAEIPEVGRALRAEHARARQAERTALSYEEWLGSYTTLIGAAWVLSCVFVRFLEDNQLIDPPRISGPADRLNRARDEHELYFRSHPTHTDRDYLLAVFDDLARLPGAREIFGPHNSLRQLPNWLSGDAAGELLGFFSKIDPNVGHLLHDFTDAEWDTHFLGDLYQDLSKVARKRYALLQTPEFVAEFILDWTLDPALDEFGLNAEPVKDSSGQPISSPGFRMIDPACGSGHFLLGSFHRILDRWQRAETATPTRELVQRTLNSVHGVDVNPYAVAIARFRLLLATMKACGISRLADAPAFHINVACGDALLHGSGEQMSFGWRELDHVYPTEDQQELHRILRAGAFHTVVANPPYITPKDSALNQAYRERYRTCHRQYSLAIPFLERIFRLSVERGFTGQITANSFMKREFGKKLIEDFLPKIDLTHVIDTSGAYIPGHGTPTVILFGRNRGPLAATIRTVMGIRGEPSTPNHPSQALVWSAILRGIDQPGSVSEFVSVADSERELFGKHPWSIGGGGAAELKGRLDRVSAEILEKSVASIGFFQDTHADEAFVQPVGFAARHRIRDGFKAQIRGDNVRDWMAVSDEDILFPYDENLMQWTEIPRNERWSWLFSLRTQLWARSTFGGGTYRDVGRPWYDYHQFPKDRARTPLSIVFAFVATHNHFVLDSGGNVFNRSAPVVKLSPMASKDDHLGLLGLLNSSIACFWIKQVAHNKGSTVDQHGARQTTVGFENFWEHDGTKLKYFPLAEQRPVELSRSIDDLARKMTSLSPRAVLADWQDGKDLLNSIHLSGTKWQGTRNLMIALQEELDWYCYFLYEIVDEDLRSPVGVPPIDLGQRAFEIVLARRLAAKSLRTTWFERHQSTPVTELPDYWPQQYKRIVNKRIDTINNFPDIALIEQPDYKRRWNTERWDLQFKHAMREWLLERLETYFDFDGPVSGDGRTTAKLNISLVSVSGLSDRAREDKRFMEAAEVYRDDPAFDVQQLTSELVEAESVPLLPVLRYKLPGLRKRAAWEETWDLERQEDAIDARTKLPNGDPQFLTEEQARELKRNQIGEIPVPPKYTSADFLKSHYWRLRGKLDVPKERWVSFPYCDGADGTMVIAWAGYDHLQLARAISAYYVEIQERLGGREDPRLEPLLACLIELLPWLKHWHNDIDPEFGVPMGDYFEGFIAEEARQMGKTPAQVKAWQPPQRASGRTRRRRVVSESS